MFLLLTRYHYWLDNIIGTTNSDQLMRFFLDGSEFRIRTGLTRRDCLWHFKKYVSVYPNGDLLWIYIYIIGLPH